MLERRNTIGDAFRRSAARQPGRVALHFEERAWTYRELDQGANRVARHLLALGLQKGDRVAAYGKNSDAYLLLFLGCARAGLVHVPINFALSGDELAFILGHSGSRAVFCDPALAGKVAAIRSRVAVEHAGTIRGGDADDVLRWAGSGEEAGEPDVGLDDGDLAQLLYTSGTTAAPRGAMLTHRALVTEYYSCVISLDLHGGDRPLHVLPLYHSAQLHVFVVPYLLVGATSWLAESPMPRTILELVERHRIDSFFAPPTVWIAMQGQPEFATRDLSSLRKAYYGASIMPVPVLEALQRRLPGLGFYNCFGQSEIGPLATVLRPEEHAARPASAGRPLTSVELRVVDDDMNDVPVGEVGEVVYRSPQLCLGYWQNPRETAEAFAGGWFHSGDLARADAEGFITVVDRKKDVINTGGVVVASREVEEVIYLHPAVREVAVIGVAHATRIETVAAVVVLKEGAAVDAEAIIHHCRGHLAPFKVPRVIQFAPELPKNASGKVLKRLLRDRFHGAEG
ncbi:MAG: fatty acyl-CoA synthetase [Anaeromyxobacteraceae bacterium]